MPCSPVEVNRRFGICSRKNHQEVGGLIFVGISLGLLFGLRMEAIYSSETSFDFYLIARRYIPEHVSLYGISYLVAELAGCTRMAG
jgi:hypothetical protein